MEPKRFKAVGTKLFTCCVSLKKRRSFEHKYASFRCAGVIGHFAFRVVHVMCIRGLTGKNVLLILVVGAYRSATHISLLWWLCRVYVILKKIKYSEIGPRFI